MREGMHRIYVIRHGETEWSAAGKHTSHTDIALTARGESQSRALAERLAVVVLTLYDRRRVAHLAREEIHQLGPL